MARYRAREDACNGRGRAGAGARLFDAAARHAAGDGGRRSALRLARIRPGRALQRQPDSWRSLLRAAPLGRGDVAEPIAEVIQPLVPFVREGGDALHGTAGEIDQLLGWNAVL